MNATHEKHLSLRHILNLILDCHILRIPWQLVVSVTVTCIVVQRSCFPKITICQKYGNETKIKGSDMCISWENTHKRKEIKWYRLSVKKMGDR